MTNVLIIKMSSLGDVIHTLPAVTEACSKISHLQFDWVVEEGFAEVPRWHPAVEEVLPIALRRWRRSPFQAMHRHEWKTFYQRLRQKQYDLIIDAQGLLKSAVISWLGRGIRYGLDKQSARESLASFLYQRKCYVDTSQHAILRTRSLFAQAFDYTVDLASPINYGVRFSQSASSQDNYVVFVHGTTWPSKQLPLEYWLSFVDYAKQAGLRVKIPWGNAVEHERASVIAGQASHVDVLPSLGLKQLAEVMMNAKGVLAVDTGLGHLAAALEIPTLSIYGPTNPERVGTMGVAQHHLPVSFPCAPCVSKECHYIKPTQVRPACFGSLPPRIIWERFVEAINV